jgi:multimeric flavodoxin WrbA
MARLLIVSHCPSDNTRAMTEAVLRGARHPELGQHDVRVTEPLKSGPDDVRWADGLILGTTENFGYMSGAMKDFFDRIYYPCLERTAGLPWALFIRAGNDGQGALSSIERIVTGLAWKSVQEPLLCRGAWDEAWLLACEELGTTVMAGLEAGIY